LSEGAGLSLSSQSLVRWLNRVLSLDMEVVSTDANLYSDLSSLPG
jgi:hypothetical protein